MKEEKISYRMYGLVPGNISEIQKGIQFGHAVVEYAQEYFNDENYQNWAQNHKTFIILNGGTSSSMVEHTNILKENGIKVITFREPDLNDMLSGTVFLVDSRVYDRENYPDLYDYCVRMKGRRDLPKEPNGIEFMNIMKEMSTPDYMEWVKFMGGEKNIFLRNYLSNFRFA